MPDSFGKRQRREVKAKKAAAREGRRLARARRREDRAAGLLAPGAPEGPPHVAGDDALVVSHADDLESETEPTESS